MQVKYQLEYRLHAESLAFRRKRRKAEERLVEILGVIKNPYIGWSGGKDSEALLILAFGIGATKIPVMTQADDLDWTMKKSLCDEVIRILGFEDYEWCESKVSAAAQLATDRLEIKGTFSHVIHDYEARRGRDGVILGLRMQESKGRNWFLATKKYLYQTKSGRWLANPLYDWTGRDVFALIIDSGLPYMPLYDCDDLKAPHEWRMSWPLNPKYLRSGEAVNLKRRFPTEWQRMEKLQPHLKDFL